MLLSKVGSESRVSQLPDVSTSPVHQSALKDLVKKTENVPAALSLNQSLPLSDLQYEPQQILKKNLVTAEIKLKSVMERAFYPAQLVEQLEALDAFKRATDAFEQSPGTSAQIPAVRDYYGDSSDSE